MVAKAPVFAAGLVGVSLTLAGCAGGIFRPAAPSASPVPLITQENAQQKFDAAVARANHAVVEHLWWPTNTVVHDESRRHVRLGEISSLEEIRRLSQQVRLVIPPPEKIVEHGEEFLTQRWPGRVDTFGAFTITLKQGTKTLLVFHIPYAERPHLVGIDSITRESTIEADGEALAPLHQRLNDWLKSEEEKVLYLPNTETGRKEAKKVAKLFQGRQQVAFFDAKNPPDLQGPTAKDQPLPIYPQELKRKGIEGTVMVALIVDVQGAVVDAAVVSSTNPGFTEAALVAVRQWKFTPASYRQTNFRTILETPVNFDLNSTPVP